MPALPSHIECFDNSNIMGTNPFAAVLFSTGSKQEGLQAFQHKNGYRPRRFFIDGGGYLQEVQENAG